MRQRQMWRYGRKLCTWSLVALAFGTLPSLVQGDPITNVIEIDGDPHDGAAPGLDWCCLEDGSCIGDPRVKSFSGRLFDLCPDNPDSAACQSAKEVNSVFHTNSKDELEIGGPEGEWRHVTGTAPDKDDIVNAMAALLIDPEGTCSPGSDNPGAPCSADGECPNGTCQHDEILAFAGDRHAITGTAQIGFWAFQDLVSPLPGGTFAGLHGIGDILVLAEFTTGGTVANLSVCEWRGVDNVHCTDITGNPNAAASTNIGDNIDTCWAYRTKSNSFPEGKYPENSFFSGAINLTALADAGILLNPPGCFSSFLLETRSSHEISAVLKDFALGGFDTCADVRGNKLEVADDGTCDTEVGPLANWEIQLLDATGNLVTVDGNGEPLVNPTCTGADGSYEFLNVIVARDYIVCEVIPDRESSENFDWIPCLPDPGNPGVALSGGPCGSGIGQQFCYDAFRVDADIEKDFHNFKRLITTDLRGVKFCDVSGNGVLDPVDDSPLEGFCIVLAKPDGSTETAVTAANGAYEFVVESGQGPYLITEDLSGVACGSADMSADWISTTTTPLVANPAPGQVLVDGLNIGNASVPAIQCNVDACAANGSGCEVCFTLAAENVCGDVTVNCTATGPDGQVTLSGLPLSGPSPQSGLVCGEFPAGCPAVTEVVCTATTGATANHAELTAECSFDVNVSVDIEVN
jgi:hypothetical protein